MLTNSLLYNSINLNITSADYTVCYSDWKEKNVISPFSRMYYILDGEGNVTVRGKRIELRPGNLYFIPLGTLFDYNCESRLEKIFLHVNLFLDNKLDFFSELKEVVSVPFDNKEELLTYFGSEGIFSRIALNGIIYKDLLRIAEASMKDYNVLPHSKTVSDALKYINTNLTVKLKIKDIADGIFVSQSQLTKKFFEEMKTSIGKYIDTRVTFEAERMIASGEFSIDAISETLGFCDRFYFTRRFKEQTGMTPGEYKKQMENQTKKMYSPHQTTKLPQY